MGTDIDYRYPVKGLLSGLRSLAFRDIGLTVALTIRVANLILLVCILGFLIVRKHT